MRSQFAVVFTICRQQPLAAFWLCRCKDSETATKNHTPGHICNFACHICNESGFPLQMWPGKGCLEAVCGHTCNESGFLLQMWL